MNPFEIDPEEATRGLISLAVLYFITVVLMLTGYAAYSIDPVAPSTGADGNLAIARLGGLAMGLSAVGVVGTRSLTAVGRRLDDWRSSRSAASRHALSQQAAALGMNLETDPAGGHPVFVGRRDGVWLRLHLTATPHLVASHRLTLPAGFRLAAGPGGTPLGNPVLDAVLCAMHPGVIDWNDPALTGLLLEALHGHPGSTLDAHTLRLHSLDAESLDAALGLACDLVTALRQPVTP